MPSFVAHAREDGGELFDYELPRELIAQNPAERRDGSRLMVVDRAAGSIRHGQFAELPELLDANDLLVGNDSGVVPARLQARKASGGAVECLVLPPASGARMRALTKSSKPLRAGASLTLADGTVVTVAELHKEGRCLLELRDADWDTLLRRVGKVPLPPYIRNGEEGPDDRERYQTVYAGQPGSIAAPTAGLHFTAELLARIRLRGTRFVTLTLHVGPGTFAPIRTELADHVMEAERASIGVTLVREIEETRRRGGRVTAVGTTTVRALESAADPWRRGQVRALDRETDLFIRPGFSFAVCDRVLTNFHLPRSTLLCLVAAFAGEALTRRAYEEAVSERYRFYSYGDAMLIV